ncbi:MAG: hypothetical protein M1823_006054 [Watsoniomyces obsoletus]|nr:MAG: hypothetical protein M1823_006054 [Watsoniomyces obsoletus]
MLGYYQADRLWMSWARIKDQLGFDNNQKLWEWMTSDLFRPYWLELWNDYFLAERQRVGEHGKITVPDNERIIQRLHEGKRHDHNRTRYGRDTRGHQQLDKTNWDALDHFASFIYTTTNLNRKSREGIFMDLFEDDHPQWARMTMVMRRIAQDHLPPRIEQDTVGRQITEGRLPQNATDDDHVPPATPPTPPANVPLGDGKISVQWLNAPHEAPDFKPMVTSVRFLSFAEFRERIDLDLHLPETGHIIKELWWCGPAWKSDWMETGIDSDEDWAVVREAARPMTTQALQVHLRTIPVDLFTTNLNSRILLGKEEFEQRPRGRRVLYPQPIRGNQSADGSSSDNIAAILRQQMDDREYEQWQCTDFMSREPPADDPGALGERAVNHEEVEYDYYRSNPEEMRRYERTMARQWAAETEYHHQREKVDDSSDSES